MNMQQLEDRAEQERPTTFAVGRAYSTGGYADYVWRFRVTSRTARFVTLEDLETGETRRAGVRWHAGHEVASPLGRYSQAPVISADLPLAWSRPGGAA